MARSPRKNMASKFNIINFWAEKLIELGKFDSIEELLEANYCFACSFEFITERCHILPLSYGGSNEADNLHNLCNLCHKASEFLTGESYWRWFKKRNIIDRHINNMHAWAAVCQI
jgi:hypothetical protein